MKIAIVNSEYPSISGSDHGGISTYTYTIAALLARYGNTVHVFGRVGMHKVDSIPNVCFHQFGFRRYGSIISRIFCRLSNNPILWEKGQSEALCSELGSLAATDGLDIIEFPDYGGLAYSYLYYKKIPYIITFHMPSELVDHLNGIQPERLHRLKYRMERKAMKHAAAFKSPSNAMKNWVIENYRIPSELIYYIRNPFNIEPMLKIRKNENLPPGFDILFSGRLERRKGAEILLNSIKEILSIDRSIRFTIAGETQIGESLNYRQAIEGTLSPEERKRIWFPGPLPADKLFPLYHNSSLFLFPSLFENSPYSLIEAMASGLPPVATSCGGITEIITHGQNGLLFPPDKPQTLIAYIKRLFADRILLSELGKNAAQTIGRIYNNNTIEETHCGFYRSVLDNKK